MNVDRFIAGKMIWGKSSNQQRGGTKTAIRISILGISLGVAVMILSLCIVTGFQQEIRSKAIGFGGHIQLRNFSLNSGIDDTPVQIDQPFYPEINSVPEVNNIQVFANKAGILKTEEELSGVMVKGIYSDFDWSFFAQNLVEGKALNIVDSVVNDSILISEYTARRLKLKLNDKVYIYFVENNHPRPRKFYIGGIYNTGLAQFDERIVLADIRHIQKINKWSKNQVGGFEINLKRYEDLDKMDEIIRDEVGFALRTEKITDKYIDIFSWLKSQDINITIILTLMLLVSGVTMTTALLILILERTNMIGVLKSMGARNWTIRKIFLYNAAYLTTLGLLGGNIIGIGLAFLQQHYGFITLNEEIYYLSQVPININLFHIILLNVGTLIACTLMLIVPSYVITKISPVKAIRFN